MRKTAIIGALSLLVMLAMAAPSAAVATYYLVPVDSNVPDCTSIEVELRVDGHGVTNYAGGQTGLTYDASCANVTNVEFASWLSPSPYCSWNAPGWDECWERDGVGMEIDWILWEDLFYEWTDDRLICTITINCSDPSGNCDYCTTGLNFTCGEDCSYCPIAMGDGIGDPVDIDWVNGTFECGEEEPDMPDLIVESVYLNPNCKHYYFANEPNEIDVTIKNIGIAAAGASHTKVTGASGGSVTVAVGPLAPGASETVTVPDAVPRPAGETVKAVADCDGEVTESDETNNDSPDETVVNHGCKGKRFTGGEDIITKRSYDLNGNLVYSIGDSVYISGKSLWTDYTVDWTTCTDILPVPKDATVLEATLYTMYTWDKHGAMPDGVSMTFNTVDQEPEQAHYMDEKMWSTSSYPYGMLVYDVTSEFYRDSNTATLTKADPNKEVSMRGMMLVVVYSDENEPRRQIFINEGFDYLYGGDSYCTTPAEATAYAPINGVDIVGVVDADLITVAPSAGAHNGVYNPTEGDLGFNAQTWLDAWDFLDGTGASSSEESQLGVRDIEVTPYLAVDNEVRFTSSGDWMEASNAILVVTYDERGTECLGTCYEDAGCTADPIPDMTCADCIATPGNYWHPNKDSNCFPAGATPEDMCIDWCPECCDGIDNEGDGATDFPADLQCSCGLDPDEWIPSCPIPELSTVALIGCGLLMLVGLIRYRRR